MSKKILLAFVFVSNAYFLSAQNTNSVQTTKSWTWNNYKISFQAPDDLVVKENSATLLYAGNDHVFLALYPKKGENLDQTGLRPALEKWAMNNKVNFSPSNSSNLSNNSRFWSYYVSGSGYKGMFVYVAVLVDSLHPEDSYYVWLQYQDGYSGAAMNILNSFNFK